jgi:hypothetical protein
MLRAKCPYRNKESAAPNLLSFLCAPGLSGHSLPFCKKITNLEGFCNTDEFNTSVKPASEPSSNGSGQRIIRSQSISSDVRQVAALAPKMEGSRSEM